MARRRLAFQRGRMRGDRHALAPSPQPPGAGPASKSQGPAHGQGIGLGLFLLGLGTPPGLSMHTGPQAAFPHTPILDTFDRADNTVLGANWGQPLHPGGLQGYTSTTMGISGNQAYNRETAGANKASSWWSVTTFAANQEAYFTIGAAFGDWTGVALRCQNVGGIAVRYYFCQTNGTSWGINREDSQNSDNALASGTMTAFVAGDKIGGKVYDAAGNVTIELWTYRAATGIWTKTGNFTDSSANKITGTGNVGIVCGNANGSSVGRANDFGGGNS